MAGFHGHWPLPEHADMMIAGWGDPGHWTMRLRDCHPIVSIAGWQLSARCAGQVGMNGTAAKTDADRRDFRGTCRRECAGWAIDLRPD